MAALRHQLDLRVDQRMTLLPRMLQSIEVLQLATLDLCALIERELEQNETLEATEPDRDQFELERAAAADADDDDPKLALLRAQPSRGVDLFESVRHQVALLDLGADLAGAVVTLAAHLDDHGYLDPTDGALRAAVDPALFDAALEVLQHLEPVGLGASGPIEAALLQIAQDDPDRELIVSLLERHFDAIARNRLPDVAAALELDVADVEELLARVARLDLCPARAFRDDPVPVMRPDVQVRSVDGRHEVVVDDVALPVLSVSADYARMARDAALPREVRSYLNGKLRAARELIHAVEHRNRTLCAVAAAILAEQPGFLRRGRRAIRPLRMAVIAERVGLHTSTISRAIAGKHLGCDHGVVALREFFDGDRRDESAANDRPAIGRAAVLQMLRDLVAAEDARAPVSDDTLARQLADRGARVARRTVAKLRAELGIPPRDLRRRFGPPS